MSKKLFSTIILMLLVLISLQAQAHFTIGNGTAVNSDTGTPTPYGTWYKNFREQYLYTANEFYALGVSTGTITAIAFNVQNVNTCTAMPNYRIRLKATNQSVLSSVFEPGAYTQVFVSNSYMPVQGWNTHTFTTPFEWDGVSNILVDVLTDLIPGSFAHNASVFYSNTTGYSSLRYQSDNSAASVASSGSLSRYRSNARFTIISQPITDPPEAANLVYPANTAQGVLTNASLSWTSGGGVTAGYKINLGTNNPPSNLLYQHNLDSSFTYTHPGLWQTNSTYYWQIVPYNSVGNAVNCPVWSFRTDASATITIGDGIDTGRVPMDFYYRSSLFETLYYPSELFNTMGSITGIEFYNQFNTNLTAIPTKVWIGTTDLQNLASGWIPSTELTLVYDGSLNFPSGNNAIQIPFIEPYLYLDGRNIVLMVSRPMDTQYYSSNDRFRTQNLGNDRARNYISDSSAMDPAFPSGGNASGTFPQSTFYIIPGGVGHINGRVTDSANQALSGVEVWLNEHQSTTFTDANGEYSFVNLLPENYLLSFDKHGYHMQQHSLDLLEDSTEVFNITLQPMAKVLVSGMIIASDSQQGIAGASITLLGYEDYSITSMSDGSFLFAEVFASQTYSYQISHPAYSGLSGSVIVGQQAYSFGHLLMNELAFAPHTVIAVLAAAQNAVNLTWQSPNPDAIGLMQSFEDAQFPPADWSQVISNTGGVLANGAYPTWHRHSEIVSGSTIVTPSAGSFQAGLWWIYEHQDEWLISASFNCPSDALLSFDTRVYLGSEGGDHYYVKLSTDDGNSWIELWDASTQSGGWNNYEIPIAIDLGSYSGRQIRLAFQAEDGIENDGLWYDWFIDNVEVVSSMARSQRGLESYDIWRFTTANMQAPESWTQINVDPVEGNSFSDLQWPELPQGEYTWAVQASYSNGVYSSAAISNPLTKSGGIPATPQNLQLVLDGEDAYLSWDAVTTDTSGHPLMGADYEVHVLNSADELPSQFTIMDITSETSYFIPELTPYLDRIFFCVKARVGDRREQDNPLKLKAKFRQIKP